MCNVAIRTIDQTSCSAATKSITAGSKNELWRSLESVGMLVEESSTEPSILSVLRESWSSKHPVHLWDGAEKIVASVHWEINVVNENSVVQTSHHWFPLLVIIQVEGLGYWGTSFGDVENDHLATLWNHALDKPVVEEQGPWIQEQQHALGHGGNEQYFFEETNCCLPIHYVTFWGSNYDILIAVHRFVLWKGAGWLPQMDIGDRVLSAIEVNRRKNSDRMGHGSLVVDLDDHIICSLGCQCSSGMGFLNKTTIISCQSTQRVRNEL